MNNIKLILLILIFLSLMQISAQEYIKKHYDNGSLKGTYYLIGGSIEGELKTFYENGRLKEEGLFKDGIKNGVFKSYYNNGNGKLVEKYIKGVLKDTLFYFREDKTINLKIIVDSGRFYKFYENGKLKKEGNYAKLQIDNNMKSPLLETIGNSHLSPFLDKSNEFDFKKLYEIGSYREYYPNGKVNKFYSQEKSIKKLYFEDGSLMGYYKLKGWKTHGEFVGFHKNGKLRLKGQNVEGSRDGHWEWFYDNRKKKTKLLYDKNKLIEIVYKRLRNGKRLNVGNLKDGNGMIINYNKKGGVIDTTYYKNGFSIEENLNR